MFEEMASDAIKMLIFFFWVTLTFVILYGTLWMHAQKKTE
jgi:hypothetical protein